MAFGSLAQAQTGPPLASEIDPQYAGIARVDGLHERRFNPLTGTLEAKIGAEVSADEDAIVFLVNGEPADISNVTLGKHSVRLDYQLTNGVNDVLVLLKDRDGGVWRGDTLIWAGAGRLTVDVVDAEQRPLHNAEVTLAVERNTAVQAKAFTQHGAVEFDKVPDTTLIVSARHADYPGLVATLSVDAGSGNVMLQLSELRK